MQTDEPSDDVPSIGGDGSNTRKPDWVSLPLEIWETIIKSLRPVIRPDDHTFPHPSGEKLYFRPRFKTSHNRDLRSMALTCKLLSGLALRELYRAPFLDRDSDVKRFLSALRRGKFKQASWINALHFARNEHYLSKIDPEPELCDCDLHVLLSRTPNVHFLSLSLEYDWLEYEERFRRHEANHPALQILGHRTKCRPQRLRLSLGNDEFPLDEADSFAPLSRLTHLEVSWGVLSPDLISFLVGVPSPTRPSSNVQDALTAGLSPRLTLECLRFSALPDYVLYNFQAYVAWRRAREEYDELTGPQKATRSRPSYPDLSPACLLFQEALYELAINAGNVPNLRILTLEVDSCYGTPDFQYLETLSSTEDVEGFCNDRIGVGFGEAATRSVLPWFSTLSRSSQRDTSHGQPDVVDESSFGPKFRQHVRRAEHHWRRTEAAMNDLRQLWSRSRLDRTAEANGLVQTEIRMVARRSSASLTSADSRRDFFCQAEASTPAGARYENLGGREGRTNGTQSNDIGVWADPDLSVVLQKAPWLPYRRLPDLQICYWTGELPREIDVYDATTSSRRRQVMPVIVDLRTRALDEQGRRELAELVEVGDEDGPAMA